MGRGRGLRKGAELGERSAAAAARLRPFLRSPSVSPYYRTKLRGLYTTAKADAEAECK